MIVAVDTETTGLHPDDGARVAVVSAAWRDEAGQLRAKAWPYAQGGIEQPYNRPADHWRRLMGWLRQQDVVMHNAKFDVTVVRAGTPNPATAGVELLDRLIWDTMVAQSLLDPLESRGLKETAARLKLADGHELIDVGQRNEIRSWLRKNKRPVGRYDEAPWELVEPYAADDARLTLLLYELQQARFEAGDAELKLMWREMDFLRVLTRMEWRGIGFDAQACRESAAHLHTAWREVAELIPFAGDRYPCNINVAKRFFFGSESEGGLGVIPYQVTPAKRDPVLNEDITARMVKANVPYAKEYQQLSKIESALRKYYDAWPGMTGADGRLRTDYKQVSVVTGRLAAARVALQGIAHDEQLPTIEGVQPLRSFFRASPGRVLWEIDLNQAELRVAASLSGDRGMREAVLSGDVHGQTTRMIWQVGPGAEDGKEHAYKDCECAACKRFLQRRLIAKRINFGILYGGGAKKLAEVVLADTGLEVTQSQAAEWISSWHEVFPMMSRASRQAAFLAERRGWLRLKSGKLRWFAPHEPLHKAFNAVIQGGVADSMRDAMIEIEERMPDMLLLQIHDSVVLEVPQGLENLIPVVQSILRRIFEDAFKIDFKSDAKRWE